MGAAVGGAGGGTRGRPKGLGAKGAGIGVTPCCGVVTSVGVGVGSGVGSA